MSTGRKRGRVKYSPGPEPDVDFSAPRLTTADLIERRKAPLMPDTGVGWGESIDVKSTFMRHVMSHASVIKMQHGNISSDGANPAHLISATFLFAEQRLFPLDINLYDTKSLASNRCET